MGDTQAMLHQHVPKIKRPHLLSLGDSCSSKKLKPFSSTLKFKLNTSVWVGCIFILTYETLMLDHPCNRADSVLRAHICQVALKQRISLAGPSLPARCLCPQPTVTAKTEHRSPEMTRLLSIPSLFTPQATPVSEVGWVTSESHTPF